MKLHLKSVHGADPALRISAIAGKRIHFGYNPAGESCAPENAEPFGVSDDGKG
jgi:hypothetical protein